MKFRGLLLLFFCLIAQPAQADPAALTQRDWLVNLIDSLGASFGLPDRPGDEDYLRLMAGRRSFRIEAEAAYQPGDAVAPKSYATFGPYSGSGWLSGTNTPTRTRLQFLLPLGGQFQAKVALRTPGHVLELSGQRFEVDGGGQFSEILLGPISLSAGRQELLVQLPPDGGIDYLELTATDLPPVQPSGGWRLDQPLTLDDLAVTTVQLLGLEPLLPASDQVRTIEAESTTRLDDLEVTSVSHLGEPSAGRWVRAAGLAAQLQLTIDLPRDGVFAISLRGAAREPTTLAINQRHLGSLQFPSYLGEVAAGVFSLAGGRNILSLTIPPRGGVDAVYLTTHGSEGSDYRRLVGLPAAGSTPSIQQMNRLLALLASLGISR